jgi:hypothetical protein
MLKIYLVVVCLGSFFIFFAVALSLIRRHWHHCKEPAGHKRKEPARQKRHLIAKYESIISPQPLQFLGGFSIGQSLGPMIWSISVGGFFRHFGAKRGQNAYPGRRISPGSKMQSAPLIGIDYIDVTETAILCGITLVDARA